MKDSSCLCLQQFHWNWLQENEVPAIKSGKLSGESTMCLMFFFPKKGEFQLAIPFVIVPRFGRSVEKSDLQDLETDRQFTQVMLLQKPPISGWLEIVWQCQATIKLQCSSTTIVASCWLSRQNIEDRTSPGCPVTKSARQDCICQWWIFRLPESFLPYLTWIKPVKQKCCSLFFWGINL